MRDEQERCRNCQHGTAAHPLGGPCKLKGCEGICDGWDPMWDGEPIPVIRKFKAAVRAPQVLMVNVSADEFEWIHGLPLRGDLVQHSSGFEWGYLGSGPFQLAAAILGMCLPRERTLELYEDYATEVIAVLPRAPGWMITEEDVVNWAMEKEAELGRE